MAGKTLSALQPDRIAQIAYFAMSTDGEQIVRHRVKAEVWTRLSFIEKTKTFYE